MRDMDALVESNAFLAEPAHLHVSERSCVL
jgi:hypothetical protein